MRNLFCDHQDPRNEADVGHNFARRLVETLWELSICVPKPPLLGRAYAVLSLVLLLITPGLFRLGLEHHVRHLLRRGVYALRHDELGRTASLTLGLGMGQFGGRDAWAFRPSWFPTPQGL